MDSEIQSQFVYDSIIIKNIPFDYPEEGFVDKLFPQLGLVSPYAFNYHRDKNDRVFRGFAFANFKTADEAQIAVDKLNNYELGGRRLRVELKKKKLSAEEEQRQRLTRQSKGQVQSAQSTETMSMILEILNPALRPRIIYREPSIPIPQSGIMSI